MLEGELAADLKDMPIANFVDLYELLEEEGGENDWLLPDGVQSVVKSLASSLPDEAISLSERVTNIDWTDDDRSVLSQIIQIIPIAYLIRLNLSNYLVTI